MPNLRAWNPWLRYPALLLINAVPMVLNILLYRIGAGFQILGMLPCLAFMAKINFDNTGIVGFVFIQVYYGLCRSVGAYLSGLLYCRNVTTPGDPETLYVVGLLTAIELTLVFAVTVVSSVYKLVRQNKESRNSGNTETL